MRRLNCVCVCVDCLRKCCNLIWFSILKVDTDNITSFIWMASSSIVFRVDLCAAFTIDCICEFPSNRQLSYSSTAIAARKKNKRMKTKTKNDKKRFYSDEKGAHLGDSKTCFDKYIAYRSNIYIIYHAPNSSKSQLLKIHTPPHTIQISQRARARQPKKRADIVKEIKKKWCTFQRRKFVETLTKNVSGYRVRSFSKSLFLPSS